MKLGDGDSPSKMEGQNMELGDGVGLTMECNQPPTQIESGEVLVVQGDGGVVVAYGGGGLIDLNNDQVAEVQEGEVVYAEDITYSTPDGKRHRLVKDCVGVVATPCVGMIFKNWEEIESYFRSYAKQQGFGIVRAASACRQFKGAYLEEKRSCTWRCNRWGTKDTRRKVNGKKVKLHSVGENGVKLATRKSKKCYCPVIVRSSRDKNGQWVIRMVSLEHVGHSPKPSEARYVSRYRQEEITDSVRKKLRFDLGAGGRLPIVYRSIAMEKNGVENVMFNERDLRNMVAKDRKIAMDMEGGDAATLVNYFKRMQELNKKIYHAERVDRFDRLKDIMWVDARSRAAYLEFSDVVCFDSTYITNEFQLPFAIFVGVNHHGQTTLLGCALLSHEDSETFEWLFKSWLTCMHGVAPAGILTDQCAAMRKALANVMPDTRHRWCLWHIMNKFKGKLRSYGKYKEFKVKLHRAIYESLTPEEFEETWCSVIKDYKLEENEWLAGLYKEREMWVPVYMKYMFWAGMKTTQRSESINSFFDGYVHKHTRLHEFGPQYFAAMQFRVKAEEDADADSHINIQTLVSEFPFEVQLQKRYTNNKFYEFQVECLKLMYVNQVARQKLSDHLHEHLIEDIVWYRCKSSRKDIPTHNVREYVVKYDSGSGDAWCVCKHFECHGILCRHLIRVFQIRKVQKLNEKFILRRWCKDIERQHTKIKVNYGEAKSDEEKRRDVALNEFDPLSLMAGKSDENLDFVVTVIREALAKLDVQEGEKDHTPIVASRKRSKSQVSPESMKKPSQNPATPGVQESVGEIGTPVIQSSTPANTNTTDSNTGNMTTNGNSDVNATSGNTTTIKDSPMPKKPKHRTTDSRYKSAAELNTGKGKTAAKGKGKGKNKNTTQVQPDFNIEEAIHKYMQSQLSSFGQFPWPNFQPNRDQVMPAGHNKSVVHSTNVAQPWQGGPSIMCPVNPGIGNQEVNVGGMQLVHRANPPNGVIGPSPNNVKTLGGISLRDNSGPAQSSGHTVQMHGNNMLVNASTDLGLSLSQSNTYFDPIVNSSGPKHVDLDLNNIQYFTHNF